MKKGIKKIKEYTGKVQIQKRFFGGYNVYVEVIMMYEETERTDDSIYSVLTEKIEYIKANEIHIQEVRKVNEYEEFKNNLKS